MLFIRAATKRIKDPLRAARKAARGAISMPRSTATADEARRPRDSASSPRTARARRSTFLNVEIGRDRRVAYVSTELDRLKAMRGDGGATVNDVMLSVATAALRRTFERRGEPVPEHIVGLVPMSIRRPDEDTRARQPDRDAARHAADLGRPTRGARLALIHAETTRLKQSKQARAASLIIEATGWTPPTINRVLAGAISRPLAFNVVISNVPGPQVPFYLLGRKLARDPPVRPALATEPRALDRPSELRRRRLLRPRRRPRRPRRHRGAHRRPRGGDGRAGRSSSRGRVRLLRRG